MHAPPRSFRGSRLFLAALLFAVIVVFDQVTKFVTRARLDIGEIWPDWPVRFTHVKNSGSAFGLFDGQTFFLIIASIIAIAFMLYFFRKTAGSSHVLSAAMGMILGGAVSNLADRIRDGNVTDMIEFPHYPVFNVADSSVVIGIVIVVLYVLLVPKTGEERAGPPAEGPH